MERDASRLKLRPGTTQNFANPSNFTIVQVLFVLYFVGRNRHWTNPLLMLCKHITALLVVSFIYCFSLTSHAQNPCGVKAIISPGNDSIISSYTAVNFQSASLNATSYK